MKRLEFNRGSWFGDPRIKENVLKLIDGIQKKSNTPKRWASMGGIPHTLMNRMLGYEGYDTCAVLGMGCLKWTNVLYNSIRRSPTKENRAYLAHLPLRLAKSIPVGYNLEIEIKRIIQEAYSDLRKKLEREIIEKSKDLDLIFNEYTEENRVGEVEKIKDLFTSLDTTNKLDPKTISLQVYNISIEASKSLLDSLILSLSSLEDRPFKNIPAENDIPNIPRYQELSINSTKIATYAGGGLHRVGPQNVICNYEGYPIYTSKGVPFLLDELVYIGDLVAPFQVTRIDSLWPIYVAKEI